MMAHHSSGGGAGGEARRGRRGARALCAAAALALCAAAALAQQTPLDPLTDTVKDLVLSTLLTVPFIQCPSLEATTDVSAITVTAYYPDGTSANYTSLEATAADIASRGRYPCVEMYCHGFTENRTSPTTMRIAADLSSGPRGCLLLVYDYSMYTGLLNGTAGLLPPLLGVLNLPLAGVNFVQSYYSAAAYVAAIAYAITNKLVGPLIDSGVISLDKLHVLGHSLGGRVTSAIATDLHDKYGEKVANCTAMDLAGPCFINKQFDAGACDCSRCIVTNGGQLGKSNPGCSRNEYMNDGTHQPCCASAPSNGGALPSETSCSHKNSVYVCTLCVRTHNASMVPAVSVSGGAGHVAGYCGDQTPGDYYSNTTDIAGICT